MTRELPILFSTPMVQAIQAETKNQTRRTAGLEKVNESPDDWECTSISVKSKVLMTDLNFDFSLYFGFVNTKGEKIECKPRYQKGDRIWVKETFFEYAPGMYDYKANYNGEPIKYKSSLFMPKVAARIWLECTGVRCERADNISEVDAINEGIGERKSQLNQKSCYLVPGSTANWAVDTATEAFKHLWNSINLKPKPIQEKVAGKLKTTGYICFPFDNSSARIYDGKTTWRGKPLTVIANPWVFIYDFKRIEK